MSKVTFQSEYKSVAIVHNWDTRKTELHLSKRREMRSDWWQYRKPEHTAGINDKDSLMAIAMPLCPVFHGPCGSMYEICQPTTGCF